MPNLKQKLLVLAVAATLTACSGGSSDSLMSENSGSTVTGTAVKGIIKSGVVKAYAVSNGTIDRARVLGSATTDANGRYSLTLPADYTGPVMVEVSAGSASTMVCDIPEGCDGTAFGTDIPLESDFTMSALLPDAKAGTSISAPVTPLTHMAAKRAEANNVIDEAQIRKANAEVAALFELDSITDLEIVDITNIDAMAAADSQVQKASLLAAALMKAAKDANGSSDLSDNLAALAEQFTRNDGQLIENDTDSSNIVSLEDILTAQNSTLTKVKARAVEGGKSLDLTAVAAELDAQVALLPTVKDDYAKTSVTVAADFNASDLDKAKYFVADIRDLAYSTGAAGSASYKVTSSAEDFAEQVEMAQKAIAGDTDTLMKGLAIGVEALAITAEELPALTNGNLEVEGYSVPVTSTENADGTFTLRVDNAAVGGAILNLSAKITDNATETESSASGSYSFQLTGSAETSYAIVEVKEGSRGSISGSSFVQESQDGGLYSETEQTHIENLDLNLIVELRQQGPQDPVSFTGKLGFEVTDYKLDEKWASGSSYHEESEKSSWKNAGVVLSGTFSNSENKFNATFSASASGSITDSYIWNWNGTDYSTSEIDNVEGSFSSRLSFAADLAGLSSNASVSILLSSPDAGETVNGTLILAYEGRRFKFSSDDDRTLVTNQSGVRMELNESEGENDKPLTGTISVRGSQQATVAEQDNGLVKVSYRDGTFESLP